MTGYNSYVAARLVLGADNPAAENEMVVSLLAATMDRVLASDPTVEKKLAWDLLCELLGTDGLRADYPSLYDAARRAYYVLDDAEPEEVVA